jgi:hypothetical protein
MSTKSNSKKSTINPPKVKEPTPTEIFIPLGEDFDWSSVVISEPETQSFAKKGQEPIKSTTSKAYVLGPNGEKLSIYFQIATQKVWGINGNWQMGTPKELQTPETLKGFQIGYPLTSTETFTEPTDDEIHTKHCFDEIKRICFEAVAAECENPRSKKSETRKVAAATYNSYKTNKDDEPDAILKPIYEYPNLIDKTSKKKTGLNKEKPQVAYLKLVTRGQSPNLVCATQIFGPGDKLMNPMKYMRFSETDKAILTEVDPVIHFEGIFYGPHGDKPYGASIKLRIVQMNIRLAVMESSLPKRRMLPANTAVEVDSDDDDGTVGGFQSPIVQSVSAVKQSSDFQDLTQKSEVVEDEGTEMSNDNNDDDGVAQEDTPIQPVEEVKPEVVVKSHRKKDDLKAKREKHSK